MAGSGRKWAVSAARWPMDAGRKGGAFEKRRPSGRLPNAAQGAGRPATTANRTRDRSAVSWWTISGPQVAVCTRREFLQLSEPPKKEGKLPSNFLIELELTQSCCWLPRAETLCGPKQKVKQRRKKGKSSKRIVKFRKSVRQATLPLIGCADETKTDEVSRTFASIFPEQGEAFHSTGNATRATQFFLGIFLFCPTRSNEALKFQSNANFHEN